MSKLIVWDVISYAWTEIGLENSDYPEYAKKLRGHFKSWKEIDQIIKRDVCASFAFETFLIFPCMLWMIMPDWGYSDEYLKERLNKWYARPYWMHFLNPCRILGYPLALLFSASIRLKVKRAYELSE